VSAATVTAYQTHTRAAKGWPTGAANETSTTPHTTLTGSPYVAGDDSTERNLREAKWTARDGLART
jgi:hypothetical protein